ATVTPREITNLLTTGSIKTAAEKPAVSEMPLIEGAARGLAPVAASFTSPANIALGGLIPEGVLGKAVAGGFTLQGLAQYPELYRRYVSTDDPAEKAAIVTEAAALVSPSLGLLPRGRAGAAAKAEPKAETRPETGPTGPEIPE